MDSKGALMLVASTEPVLFSQFITPNIEGQVVRLHVQVITLLDTLSQLQPT